LLKDDFQVQQAYNYLKAWVVIEGQRKEAGAVSPVGASAPPVQQPPAAEPKPESKQEKEK
jgi:hypothetical protein